MNENEDFPQPHGYLIYMTVLIHIQKYTGIRDIGNPNAHLCIIAQLL